jgi:hypothetical protein
MRYYEILALASSGISIAGTAEATGKFPHALLAW